MTTYQIKNYFVNLIFQWIYINLNIDVYLVYKSYLNNMIITNKSFD